MSGLKTAVAFTPLFLKRVREELQKGSGECCVRILDAKAVPLEKTHKRRKGWSVFDPEGTPSGGFPVVQPRRWAFETCRSPGHVRFVALDGAGVSRALQDPAWMWETVSGIMQGRFQQVVVVVAPGDEDDDGEQGGAGAPAQLPELVAVGLQHRLRTRLSNMPSDDARESYLKQRVGDVVSDSNRKRSEISLDKTMSFLQMFGLSLHAFDDTDKAFFLVSEKYRAGVGDSDDGVVEEVDPDLSPDDGGGGPPEDGAVASLPVAAVLAACLVVTGGAAAVIWGRRLLPGSTRLPKI